MAEEVAVVVLPVGIASQPERAGERDYEHGRAVERIDVPVHLEEREHDQGAEADREDSKEAPKPPVDLDELVREEVLPAHRDENPSRARKILLVVGLGKEGPGSSDPQALRARPRGIHRHPSSGPSSRAERTLSSRARDRRYRASSVCHPSRAPSPTREASPLRAPSASTQKPG